VTQALDCGASRRFWFGFRRTALRPVGLKGGATQAGQVLAGTANPAGRAAASGRQTTAPTARLARGALGASPQTPGVYRFGPMGLGCGGDLKKSRTHWKHFLAKSPASAILASLASPSGCSQISGELNALGD
jgi:hypothetical protein